MLGQGFNDSKLPTIDVEEEHDCRDGEIMETIRDEGRGKKKKKKTKRKKTGCRG